MWRYTEYKKDACLFQPATFEKNVEVKTLKMPRRKNKKKGPTDKGDVSCPSSKPLDNYERGDVVIFRWAAGKSRWPGVVIAVAEEEIAVRFAHTEKYT